MATATQDQEQDHYLEQLMHSARTDPMARDLYMQELIRASVPDSPEPSSGSGRVPPLRDDEIGQFYCSICMESKLVYDRFRPAECAHEFCIACLVKFVEFRVRARAVPVLCPEPACRGGELHPEACKKLLDMDVFDAWCVALCERGLGPGRAYCPYRDCGLLIALDDGEWVGGGAASRARCPGCMRAFCGQCEAPWDDGQHGGDGGERCPLLGLAEKRLWRRCPGCRAMIERIEGCKRMTCRCGYEFCYGCGSPFSKGRCKCYNLSTQ